MLGFLRPKLAPQEPVEFDDEVIIERPAEEGYALVDWADPRNAKRALGDEVISFGEAPDRFRVKMVMIPDYQFEIAVTEAIPHRFYCFTCETVPRIGRMAASHELYSFDSLGAGSCRLRLKVRPVFIEGLQMEHFGQELLTMTVACHNVLAKLKIHAEQSFDAVRVATGKLVV
jgi:hypothetical protein